jgi:hypothetical protein
MRPRSRDAVSLFVVQIGHRTARTSSVVIAPSSLDDRLAADVLMVALHCQVCSAVLKPVAISGMS